MKCIFIALATLCSIYGYAQFALQNINSPGSQWTKLQLIDMDNDGDLDVLTEYVSWFENNGQGLFNTKHVIVDTAMNAQNYVDVMAFVGGDIDNDGDQDVLVALSILPKTSGGSTIEYVWYEQTANSTFDSLHFIGTSFRDVSQVFLEDLNGDPHLDFIAYNNNPNDFDSYTSNGTKNFTWSSYFGINSFPLSFSAPYAHLIEDFDNDGDKDVVLGDFQKTIFYENRNNSSFRDTVLRPFTFPSINLGATSFVSLDFDDDGDKDILFSTSQTGGTFSSNIAWHENLGGFNFDSVKSALPLTGVEQIQAVDYDGDGDEDLMVVRSSRNAVGWIENLGSGSFASYSEIFRLNRSASIIIYEDIDNDGDIDVFANNGPNNQVTWYENFVGSPFSYNGDIFYDANQNKVKDANEVGLPFVKVLLSANGVSSFSSSTAYKIISNKGLHTVQTETPSHWMITTDSTSYTRTVDAANPSINNLDFGFYPDSLITDLSASLIGGFPRCDQQVNYWINLRNDGTSLPSGVIKLDLADSLSYLSASTPPDSIQGNSIYWHYDSLFFFGEEKIRVNVGMPNFLSIGDTLTSALSIKELDINNTVIYAINDTLNQQLRCAYDPNDKTVSPEGLDSVGYVSKNQRLEYLIRFQNTGNDTAFTVLIKDHLSENLDWNSLTIIGSSHPVQTSTEQNGKANFLFSNIQLPDSNVNKLGSQGFVKFSISPKPGLLPNTSIHNTASIYFDYNPPIVTNTVTNTIECYTVNKPSISALSAIALSGNTSGNFTYEWYFNGSLLSGRNSDTLQPKLTGAYQIRVSDTNNCSKLSNPYIYFAVSLEENALPQASMHPNPFSNQTTVKFEQAISEQVNLTIYDVTGTLVRSKQFFLNQSFNIDRKELAPGNYFISLKREDQTVLLQQQMIIME